MGKIWKKFWANSKETKTFGKIFMSRYTNISVRMNCKVNPSEGRKINVIGSVSECEYWYEFEHESEYELHC